MEGLEVAVEAEAEEVENEPTFKEEESGESNCKAEAVNATISIVFDGTCTENEVAESSTAVPFDKAVSKADEADEADEVVGEPTRVISLLLCFGLPNMFLRTPSPQETRGGKKRMKRDFIGFEFRKSKDLRLD